MPELFATLAPQLRVLHALVGFVLVSSLLGRWVILNQAERAARAQQLGSVQTLLSAGGIFERGAIISSQVVLLLGLLTAWAFGYPLLGFVQGASVNWLLTALVLYMSVSVLIPTVFVPRGKAFAAALSDSVAQGRPTSGLVSAFGDPVVRAAHVYELIAVAAVAVLMIAKPF